MQSKIIFLTILILANLVISFEVASKEGQKKMNNMQKYVNPQLNSLLPNNLSAKGELALRIIFNQNEIPGNVVSMIMLDDSKVLIDYSEVFFAVDVYNNKVMGFQRKSLNAFLVSKDDQEFYTFASNLLLKMRFDSIQNFPPDSRYFVPGLSDYSILTTFIPKADTFIAGVQNLGNPKYPQRSFSILEKTYMLTDSIWKVTFDGMVPAPPMSIDGNFVVSQKDLISIVNSVGKVKEIKCELLPISCSIGADNLIYMLCRIKNKNFIKAMHFDGNVRWECLVSVAMPNQPPIVSKESMVFLIGSSKIEAFASGEKKWEFQLTGNDEEHQSASVSNDGMLLVSDCDKLLCINKAGEQVWAFNVAKGETIMTQPVLDSVGKVFIATDKKILAIK